MSSPYDDKEVIGEYLKASGLAYTSLLLGIMYRRNSLNKTATGFDISVPNYNPASLEAFSWIGHDLGESESHTLFNTANMTFPDLVAMIAKAPGKEVTFTSVATSEISVLDEMYAAHSEYNRLYTATPVSNPDLVALGAKFGTMEEFMGEAKKHFS
ncbi:hypothetical protein C8R44DRAFT_875815 [Mycena epipterygia]|nr:hypothetical protein C8R44DRAFT_875815 [Mycena epipterygia]